MAKEIILTHGCIQRLIGIDIPKRNNRSSKDSESYWNDKLVFFKIAHHFIHVSPLEPELKEKVSLRRIFLQFVSNRLV